MATCHAVSGPRATSLEPESFVTIKRLGLEQPRRKRVLQSPATDSVIKNGGFPPTACSAGRCDTADVPTHGHHRPPSTRCETLCQLGCISCAAIRSIGLPFRALRPDEFGGRALMHDGSVIPRPYSGKFETRGRPFALCSFRSLLLRALSPGADLEPPRTRG